MAGDYVVKIVDPDGTVVVADLADVNVGPIQWELDGIGGASFTFPKASGDAGSVDLLEREAQIWRDGVLYWWGPMVMASTDAAAADVRVDVPGLGWYLTRRQISDSRPNRLSNPSFENGLTSWTASGVTATSDTTKKKLGTKSLKLVQASAGVDTFEYQTWAETGTAVGTLITVAAWVYVQSSGWVGPAVHSRGLFVLGIETATVRTTSNAEIDDATPQDRWVRLETTIWVPPGETWTIEVRLYGPGGTVWWDAVQAVRMESLSRYATDLGTIGTDIVSFVQDADYGWDDLNILTSAATSGVTADRHYQFADHVDAMMALDELVGMGLDWSFELTSTTRTFTTFYPKGTDRSATVTFAMRNGGSGNLSDYRLTVDGAATETRVTVLGDGDGPDREEGYAANPAGLMLGGVHNARPGAPIDALQAIAEDRLESSRVLVRVLEVTGIPGDSTQRDTVLVGDSVTVDITDGWVLIAGVWRVVGKTLDPATDTVSFVLNETSASVVYDGGSASATGTEVLDGGTASTSFVSSIDGGSA